jgi:antitoxin ParD1/3/4
MPSGRCSNERLTPTSSNNGPMTDRPHPFMRLSIGAPTAQKAIARFHAILMKANALLHIGQMQLTLTPEQENFIQTELTIGNYDNPDAVLAEALQLLAQRRRYDNWAKDIQEKVATATAELERGEGGDGETTIAALKARLYQKHSA